MYACQYKLGLGFVPGWKEGRDRAIPAALGDSQENRRLRDVGVRVRIRGVGYGLGLELGSGLGSGSGFELGLGTPIEEHVGAIRGSDLV